MPGPVVATLAPPTCAVEFGDVDANDDLGQAIALRRSRYEVGYYETRRWTESPDNYLRRALVRVLFDERRCRRVLSGYGPTLDARLVAFEEQKGAPSRARVQVRVILREAGAMVFEGTFDATRPCNGGDGNAPCDGFVAASSEALDGGVAHVAQRVASDPAAAASPDRR